MPKSELNRIAILTIFLTALSGIAFGQDEEGSGFPLFNPFTKKTAPDAEQDDSERRPASSARITDDEEPVEAESGFKWPSLPKPKLPTLRKPTLPKLSMPSWAVERETTRERVREPLEPSTWEKVSNGTKTFFTKTKQTLMPWADEDESMTGRRPTTPPRRTAQRQPPRTTGKQASLEKKSILPWATRKEPEKPFEGVNEFLSQPRP